MRVSSSALLLWWMLKELTFSISISGETEYTFLFLFCLPVWLWLFVLSEIIIIQVQETFFRQSLHSEESPELAKFRGLNVLDIAIMQELRRDISYKNTISSIFFGVI